MKGASETNERDDGCDFVQDQESGDVRDRSTAQRRYEALEEAWEARLEAGDP